MTLEECIKTCAAHREFVENYDRLRGTNLSLRGSELDWQIDLATGRTEAEVKEFCEFVIEYIWLRLESVGGGK